MAISWIQIKTILLKYDHAKGTFRSLLGDQNDIQLIKNFVNSNCINEKAFLNATQLYQLNKIIEESKTVHGSASSHAIHSIKILINEYYRSNEYKIDQESRQRDADGKKQREEEIERRKNDPLTPVKDYMIKAGLSELIHEIHKSDLRNENFLPALHALQESKLLTNYNLRVVIPKLSNDVMQSIILFNKCKPSLLNQKMLQLIADKPYIFHKWVRCLSDVNLLTFENLMKCYDLTRNLNSYGPSDKTTYRFFSKVDNLAKNGLLTQAFINVATNAYFDFNYIQFLTSIKSIPNLNLDESVYKKCFYYFCHGNSPITKVMDNLKDTAFFNMQTLENIFAHTKSYNNLSAIEIILEHLKKNGLLTQSNVDRTIKGSEKIAEILFTNHRAVYNHLQPMSIHSMPPKFYTQEFFDLFFELCEQSKDIKTTSKIVCEQIDKINEAYARGAAGGAFFPQLSAEVGQHIGSFLDLRAAKRLAQTSKGAAASADAQAKEEMQKTSKKKK